MKEGWERTEQQVSLDLRQINGIVRSAFQGTRVIGAERLGIGLHNSNYKIHLDGKSDPLVLRLYSDTEGIADKELALAERIRDTVPVADFLYVDTSCSSFDKPWAVMEWKAGIHLRDVLKAGTAQEIVSAATSVGTVLAQIHSYTFPAAGFLDRDLEIIQPFQMGGELFLSIIGNSLFHNQGAKWLGDELTQELWSFCQSHSNELSDRKLSPVLVHSDFNGLNILMEPNAGDCTVTVSAVLDWEFAFSCSRYTDIGNILRYEEDGSLFEQHFISAYTAHGGVLEDNWKLLSKLEDLTSLCEMISHSTVNTPNRLRDLQSLIAKTVKLYR
ncbi:phosphotransferase family protein [Paenibacillus sp. HW567]|uniref:phosphotransferase family protein n=1 Tax=Paenibacillus sp. HW567 TaxID=1034769 RepID=UPI00037E5B3A|nr:phosphotransferase [Paenibacillus sp. HW567]